MLVSWRLSRIFITRGLSSLYTDEVDLWAYLMDAWFAITRFSLVPDTLGALMEIEHIVKYQLTPEKPMSWHDIEAKIATAGKAGPSQGKGPKIKV